MRKILLSILLCCACVATMHAERPRPFEVKRLRSWAPEYLTITNPYWISSVSTHNLEDCPVKEEYIWMEILSDNRVIGGTVILSINGKTTKNMSEQTFYNLVGQKDEHELLVCDTEYGGYKNPYTVKFRTKEPPLWMQQCLPYSQSQILLGKDIPGLQVTKNKEQKTQAERLEKENKRLQQDVKMYWDKDFDWFSIQTYDFIPTQDPLADKVLMEEFISKFRHLKRNTENPDVLICLTKDEQHSVNSTYVPPTVQVVNEGSTTKRVYNYIGNNYSYQTQQKNRVIKEGDYVETTKTDDLYLEIVMLDAKRIEQTTPPIIYQLKYKRHIVNRKFDLEKEYIAVISWVTEPADMIDGSEYCVAPYKSGYIQKYKGRRRDEDNRSYGHGYKYIYEYYRVYPTDLVNAHVLGKSRFSEGDVIEQECYQYTKNYYETKNMSYSYRVAEYNGEKIKKNERKNFVSQHYSGWLKEDEQLRWVCVTFNIGHFAINDE